MPNILKAARGAALALAASLGAASLAAAPASAASCGDGPGGFPAWLESFKQEAVRAGIPASVVAPALAGVSYSSKVISLDRNQRSFKLSFDQFYKRRVSNAMINQGRSLIQRHASLLSALEQRTGVPPEIIVSIWGLETAYGRNSGSMSTFRSLATLAYDCRRSAFFTGELLAALKIVQRGDLSPGEMRGAWAGELGQTQFLASSYLRFAVDGDGNGRRDLIRSVPDVLASTANYLKAYGWQAGAGWGPGTANYNVLRQWNKAEVYVKTISVMASQMAGR